jgi:hypothetical protein
MDFEDLGGVGTSPPLPGAAGEQEKLAIPGEEVRFLLHLALRTDLGMAWQRGFGAAYGYPGWLARPGAWHVVAEGAAFLPGAPPGQSLGEGES